MQILTWYEIPSNDFSRAVSFYSTVLGKEIVKGEFGGMPYGFFNNAEGQSEGAVVHNPYLKPNAGGSLIFLAVPNLDESLGKVETAGGKVVLPKTNIGEMGFMAYIVDTEGNQVGLHGMS